MSDSCYDSWYNEEVQTQIHDKFIEFLREFKFIASGDVIHDMYKEIRWFYYNEFNAKLKEDLENV